jgi:hypothetical protein
MLLFKNPAKVNSLSRAAQKLTAPCAHASGSHSATIENFVGTVLHDHFGPIAVSDRNS